MERNLPGGRGEIPVVMTAAVALTGFAALVASRLGQLLGLLLQQLVQRFFHTAAYQFLDLTLDHFLIELYNLLGHSLLSPFECLCGNFILPEPASYVFFYAFSNLRNLLYIIPASRPVIAAKRDNMDEYDTIFVGFPIWWYIAPTIINTFLESYNLKGKTVITFATSGGSGMGKTNEKLTPSCPGAKLLHGKVFNSYSSKADLSAWVETISL